LFADTGCFVFIEGTVMTRKGFWLLGLPLLLILVLVGAGLIYLIAPELDLWPQPNRIAVIKVEGLIIDPSSVIEHLIDFRKDPNVRAILLRIDSPGGGVAPSQEIYREIKRTAGQKPVIASLGSVAASGGYYIAAATSQIVASAGTLTGSIGVIMNFPNLKELFQKIGYQTVTIKSGAFKDSGNPGRDMTDAEKRLLQATIDQVHQQFVRDVAGGRRLPLEDVEKIADGRILTGQDALQLGLIDALGNFQDAVERAAGLGEIVGEPELIYARDKPRSVAEWLFGRSVLERVEAGLTDRLPPLR